MPQSPREFIHKKNEPVRADRFLKNVLPDFSTQNIRDLIANGTIILQRALRESKKEPLKKGTWLHKGDVLVWPEMPDLSIIPIPNRQITYRVVYEDADLLIVDKPAGVATHPLSPIETATLINALVADYPQLIKVGDQRLEAGLVHRLDTGTSGLLLLAKTLPAFNTCKRLFKERRITKNYLALVHGHIKKNGIIKLQLAHNAKDSQRMVVITNKAISRPPKRILNAETHYEPQQLFADHTLLKVRIVTGVMHQIRVHLSHLGHPIVGDLLYGTTAAKPLLAANGQQRHFLHATHLQFAHPIQNKVLDVSSPLPKELDHYLTTLI